MGEEIRLEVAIREVCVTVVEKLPRVMVVSDVRLFREGMVAMLARTGRVEIIGIDGEPDRASSGSHLVPDVVLIDIGSLPPPGCRVGVGFGDKGEDDRLWCFEH